MPEAKRLLAALRALDRTPANRRRPARCWGEMLRNHAENQWTIGTVAGELQPIVVRNGLMRNVPREGALFAGSRPR